MFIIIYIILLLLYKWCKMFPDEEAKELRSKLIVLEDNFRSLKTRHGDNSAALTEKSASCEYYKRQNEKLQQQVI